MKFSLLFFALLLPLAVTAQSQPSRGYTIPIIDLASETVRQTIVDREPGQYLGHPTTVLLEDNKTIITVYPKGHGKGAIQMKRSIDEGKTWSERLPTPKSWETSLETPTIHRVIDKKGKKRLIVFSGLYPIRSSLSEDDGKIWSELKAIGDYGGIVAMGAVEQLKNGDYVALFHDDGRFFRKDGKRSPFMTLYQTFSRDGGLTWSEPQELFKSDQIHLCEPGVIRSPDGKQLAMLLRENRRNQNSHVMFSNDEAQTWTTPRELPGALTGDRHTGKYAPDGRLFISFRDTTLESKTNGDWVGWVGTYNDIVNNREGQYRVRLMKNHKNASGWNADCAYPGVEVLRDGTFVTTTYGHWSEGELPYVVSVRLRLKEVDEKFLATKPLPSNKTAVRDAKTALFGNWTGAAICQIIDPRCQDEKAIYKIYEDGSGSRFRLNLGKYEGSNVVQVGSLVCNYYLPQSLVTCEIQDRVYRFEVSGDILNGLLIMPNQVIMKRIMLKKAPVK